MKVNSWDLWGTLVAGRDPNEPDGDQREGQHFAIAENVAKVQSADVVCSDYYDDSKAERVLRNVCALQNKLFVGSGIKASGEIWKTLRQQDYEILSHTDDADYALRSAERAGIKAIASKLAPFTAIEKELDTTAFHGLARTIREARLTTFDDNYRDQQLVQIEANFPFFFLASIYLHRHILKHGYTRVLLSSRDACLWHELQKRLSDGEYDVEYFYTSRIPRYNPSPAYLRYVHSLVHDQKALIVDVCGGGVSLEAMLKQMAAPKPDVLLLVGYGIPNRSQKPNIPFVLPVSHHPSGDDTIERANLARHPMVADVDEKFQPVYTNPVDTDWANIPQINAAHEAFGACLLAMENYDFTSDFDVNDQVLLRTMDKMLIQVNRHRDKLNFCGKFFGDEEVNTRQVLHMDGPRPLVSCLMPTADRREFIPRALQCFKRQDYINLELIILDDGKDSIEDLIPTDSKKIRYFRLSDAKHNHGWKMNKCADLAKGEILIVWDDDQLYPPNRVTRQVLPLIHNDRLLITGTSHVLYFDRRSEQAWLYNEESSNWLEAIAFCKKTWQARHWENVSYGADTRFMRSISPQYWHNLRDQSLVASEIHGTNASPKPIHTNGFRPIKWDIAAKVLEEYETSKV